MQDFAPAAKIQTEISRAAHPREPDRGRSGAAEGDAEGAAAALRGPAEADQVEEVARQLTPNAAAWVRAHPDYITDPQKNARLMSAHYDAMAEGLAGDSPDYIRYVEQQSAQPPGADVNPKSKGVNPWPNTRRTAPPAAPVSRGGGGAIHPPPGSP